MEAINRLEEFHSYLKSNGYGGRNKFEIEIGKKPGYLTGALTKKTAIGSDTIFAICNKFPELNIDWLITGKGSMLKSEQIPTIMDRLKYFIKEQGLTEMEFCQSIDMYLIFFSELKGAIPERHLKNIMDKYPQLSIEWLMTGEGSMLKSTGESNDLEEQIALAPISSNTVNYKLVPLLNLDAVGGMHSSNIEADGEYINKLIPFTDAQEGDVALMVSGESMSPTCPSGSKVLIREVPKWNEYFGYGNLFVLLLSDGRRILKEVQKYPEDSKNYILCKSHNDRYPEEELPKSMIAGVWKVIKILNERGW